MSPDPGAPLAVVTGGASGIGRLMAGMLLERGRRVVIWDVDRAGLGEAVAAFSRQGDVHGVHVDVRDPAAIERAAAETLARGPVDLLINNAGVVVGKHLHEHTTAEIVRTSEVNAVAPQLITRAFLPGMMAAGRGHVCNVASSAGLVANPKMTAYAASKWSLVGFSESLRVELRQLGYDGLHVTTVCPYYIDTGMFDGVRSRIPILEPVATARAILRAVDGRKKLVTLPGYIYRLTRLSQGILSIRGLDWFAGRVFGVYDTMSGWRGKA